MDKNGFILPILVTHTIRAVGIFSLQNYTFAQSFD